MIYLGFLIFIVFLSAVPFSGAVCLKRRPERLFAAGLLLNGLLFYFACAVNLCDGGFLAILIGNIALYIPAAMKLRKEPAAIREFWTPAVKVIYPALLLAFLMTLKEDLLWWDEFSHWAFAPKLLLETGRLNCTQGAILEHASYPPGLPVLDVLVHKCFFWPWFRDFVPRFAIRTLMISLLALPFGDIPGRRTLRECAAGLLLFFLVLGIILPNGCFTCESDCILGIVFTAAVYVVMRHDRSVGDDLFLALLLAWLFLIKKAGMGFAVMTQILYVVRWIADRRSAEAPKRPVWSAFVVLAAPFAAQLSWSLLLKVHHTPIVFPVGKISLRGIWRMIRYGEPEYCGEIARLFFGRLVKFLPLFFLALGGLFWYRRSAGNRPRRDGDLWWFLPLTFAVYLASLFLTYMFIFRYYQAHQLVSFRRYVNGFLVMPLCLMLMLMLSGGWSGWGRRFFSSCSVMALILFWSGWLRNNEKQAAGWFARLWSEDYSLINSRYRKQLNAPGAKFVAVSEAGGGLYYRMLLYEYKERFVDEMLLNKEEGGRVSPQELREFIRARKAPYVLLLHPQNETVRDYAELWEEPPDTREKFALYEVTPEGRLRPVR